VATARAIQPAVVEATTGLLRDTTGLLRDDAAIVVFAPEASRL
jgi:hypothetical protein